jgi:hypothetical protein
LVHAAPAPLLQYIRRGELPAARLGKHMVIVYDDLVAFVRMIAARQTSARVYNNDASDRKQAAPAETNRQPATTTFVFMPTARLPQANLQDNASRYRNFRPTAASNVLYSSRVSPARGSP